jgi:hypothetical protein
MPQYVDEAFIVLLHVYAPNGFTERAEFVVGCSTREAAEQRIKSFFPPEADVRVFASRLSNRETAALNLLPDEIRRWP